MALLSPYRVLDLTDERGLICGEILADLGADVIAIEPPGGNRARRIGPFAGNRADDPEASLWWAAYARNKRSVRMDIATAAGQKHLRQLAAGADFLIESFDPGVMASWGLGHEQLTALNPRLVYVSISAFGQRGPKAGYAMTDLTVMAAGGPLAMMGDEDRAPLRIGVPQSFLHAGAEAAAAALVAHYERRRSGRGQHVDVSAQQAVALIPLSRVLSASLGVSNEGDEEQIAGGAVLVAEASDGYVLINVYFGNTIGPFTARLIDWMFEEGACDEAMHEEDWIGYGLKLMNGEVPEADHARVLAAIRDFVRTKSQRELFAAAIDRRLLLVPVATVSDIEGDVQLAARAYWQELDTPSLGRAVCTPGPFAKFSTTPIQYRSGAPRIGQDTPAVLSADSLAREPAAVAGTTRGVDGEALRGLKVLDFMWVVAGPSTTRVLADYGATVIKVESTSAIDLAREFPPFKNGDPGPDSSGMFHNMDAGKLSLTIDLTSEHGRQVAIDLVRWADVVCESFSPRAMRGWGLDYESLRRVRPDLIMLSSCLFGQHGPYAEMAGFGTMSAALSGFNSMIGWPDRAPVANIFAYTDSVSPRYGIAAILAALDHRERTGEGQYIDISHTEASLHFVTPAQLDFAVNGFAFTRQGNADPQMSPHAVLPAAGEGRWVAIACRDEADWRALLEVSGLTELASDERFCTLGGRLEHREALEAAIAKWTRAHPTEEIERMLQARGVPAHVVQDSADLLVDPQLQARRHFVELPHPTIESITIEGSRFALSRTPARITHPGPALGQHNHEVLAEILAYSDEQIAQLAMAGALA